MSAIERLDHLSASAAKKELERCCGSSAWVDRMDASRPFHTMDNLLTLADREWSALSEKDWLEAFSHHPKIGEGGIDALRKKFASTATWASTEQAGVDTANDQILQDLAAGNEAYANKFGFIFIVCATGKSAAEMLALLQARLPNTRETELKNAAIEQGKITALRLTKLAMDEFVLLKGVAMITTHVLDTSRGAPAQDVPLMLYFFDAASGEWQQLAASTTNAEGRAPGLLPADRAARTGTYQLTFETKAYFAARQVETFYPKVEIYFSITDTRQHYHVPLLLSPYGYSTYRGS